MPSDTATQTESDAIIRVDGRRRVLVDVGAMGALRKAIVDTLGADRARGIFRRFARPAKLEANATAAIEARRAFPDQFDTCGIERADQLRQ